MRFRDFEDKDLINRHGGMRKNDDLLANFLEKIG